jgi:hypothetical protein
MGSGGEEVDNCSADGDAEGATEQTTVFSGGIYPHELKIVKIMKRRNKKRTVFLLGELQGLLIIY